MQSPMFDFCIQNRTWTSQSCILQSAAGNRWYPTEGGTTTKKKSRTKTERCVLGLDFSFVETFNFRGSSSLDKADLE